MLGYDNARLDMRWRDVWWVGDGELGDECISLFGEATI